MKYTFDFIFALMNTDSESSREGLCPTEFAYLEEVDLKEADLEPAALVPAVQQEETELAM